MKTLEAQAKHLAITIVTVLAITVVAAWWAVTYTYGSLTLMVFMFGTVGGIANNYRRLVRMPISAESSQHGHLVTLQIYVSPLVGGVFAGVLYGLFMSGLVQGSMFPQFSQIETMYDTYSLFAAGVEPLHNQDAAKVLVWSFVAGFSETFVPNFIDKAAKEAAITDAKASHHQETREPSGGESGVGTQPHKRSA